jgi:hypothetical protein
MSSILVSCHKITVVHGSAMTAALGCRLSAMEDVRGDNFLSLSSPHLTAVHCPVTREWQGKNVTFLFLSLR